MGFLSILARLVLMAVSAPISMALYVCFAFAVGLVCSTKQKKKDDKKNDSPPPQLRVGFVHPDFGIGGAENLVVNAMLALQKKNVTVTMFTAHHDVAHCFEETRGDGPLARCVKVYGDWLPKTIFGKLYAACAWMRVMYVTLVIGFLYSAEIDAFFVDQVSISIPVLRYFGKPVLFYGHYPDKLLSIQSGSLLKRLYRWPLDFLEEISTAASDLVVVNSKFTRSVFEETFPRVKKQELGILYPPVDVSAFETFVASAPRNSTLFVSLNRFERKKNVALAIHALAELKTRVDSDVFASVKLIIAGGYDPNNTENMEHLKELQVEVAKYSLTDHVEFRTSVSDLMKKELLATAQAILYTPSKEHFGIVPVEAMTCGTPVIAVNSGGPLESIVDGETGFLCKSSADAFADAMAKVCGAANAARVAEMGAKGKKRARDLFSLETFTDSLYELVTSLI
ncbi:Alpha-1,3-mannosyltransferase, partial [Globisporangium splendens]